MKNPPHIFISYSSKDRNLVEKIHLALEAAGCKVWRDRTRLETDWAREIAFALADCDVVCLMWSQHAATSKWVKHEWLTARALEKPIVVCLLPDAPELPRPLFNLHGVSFQELQKGCKKLIERLQNLDLEPVRYDYTILPENLYIPFNPNPHFKGRHIDLLELYLKMIGNINHIGINQIGAVGMGGIGKTQLAVEFAYRFSFAYHGIYWIQAADKDHWLTQFVELARDRLQLRIPNPDTAEANKQYIFALQKYFKTHPNTLVIMDNVAEPRLLNNDALLFGLTPLTLGCDLLFTTRRHFQIPGVISQAVDILSAEGALALLTAERQPESLIEREKAKATCSAVGNLPLALTLAAGYLKAYPEVSFADYYEELCRNKLETVDLAELSPEELVTRHETSVRATLQSQWKMLKDENSRHLFCLTGLFPEAEIVPKGRLALLSGIAQEKTSLRRPLDKAFYLLHELSLIEKLDSKTAALRLHALVRDFSQRLLSEQEQREYKANAAKALNEAYFDYLRLESELKARGVNPIIDDMQVALEWSGDEHAQLNDLALLQKALRLSANQLTKDRSLLTPQLLGRLLAQDSSNIQNLLKAASANQRKPWLRPLTSSLTPAGGPLLRTLEGHRSWITSVAITLDGQRVVSASYDYTLRVWNLATGQELRTLKGHSDWINGVALTPDGQCAVSASRDKTIKVWDLASGRELRTLVGHCDSVTSVALTPDGQRVVSASRDRTLKMWDLATGQELRTLKGHNNVITSVAITLDGQRALSASNDNTLRVWDLATGQELRTLKGHSYWVNSVALTPDGERAISASHDHTLKVWDLATGQQLRTLIGHKDSINSVVLTHDGECAISASDDKTLKVWDLTTGRELRTLKGHNSYVKNVALTPDGRHAVSASSDTTLKVWDLVTGRKLRTSEGHRGAVNSIVLTPDSQRAVSASDDKTLKVWDLSTGQQLRTLIGHKDSINSVVLTHDGECAISASDDKTLKVWDLTTGRELRTLRGHNRRVNSVTLTPGGQRAVSSSLDLTLKVWDLATGQQLRTLIGHSINSVVLTPDGKRAISASDDKTLRVWDLTTGQELRTLKGHNSYVNSVALTPDGHYAVSASHDCELKVWDLTLGQELRTLKGHKHWVHSVAITSDGKLAVSASSDHTLKVWDLASGQELISLAGHSGSVHCVLISPDGQIAISAAEDKVLKMWNLQSGDEIASFIGESDMKAIAVASDGKTIVAGDTSGRVHFLRLEGLSKGQRARGKKYRAKDDVRKAKGKK